MWTDADESRARRIARKVADAKWAMFSAWPEYSPEDLQQEALKAIRKAHPRFDPTRASYSTYAYMAAGMRILDLWRSRGRKADHEDKFRADARYANSNGAAAEEHDDEDHEQTLTQWVRMIRADAHRALKHQAKAMQFALGCLMVRLSLSPRGAIGALANMPEIRTALGIDKLPSLQICRRALEARRAAVN